MSHQVRLNSRERRAKLPIRHDPYWVQVTPGLSIGYRKGATGTAWYVRRFTAGKYQKRDVGQADDDRLVPADGVSVLSWEDVLKLAIAEPGQRDALNAKYNVSKCFDDYFAHRQAKSRSAQSLYVDQSRAKPFVEKYGDSQVAELTTHQLQGWRDRLVWRPAADDETPDAERRARIRASQATANRTWRTVRAALNYSFLSGRVDSDLAWRRIKPFADADEARRRFLSVEEANRLLGACPPEFRSLCEAGLNTGLRPGELVRLVVQQFQGTRLEVSLGKTRTRFVPLTNAGQALFKKVTKKRSPDELIFTNPEGKMWTPAQMRRAMDAANVAAKLSPKVVFYDLRRTYGSLLANAGAADAVIAHSLGHADTRMTRRHYAHLLDSVVAAELQARLPTFKATKSKPRTVAVES